MKKALVLAAVFVLLCLCVAAQAAPFYYSIDSKTGGPLSTSTVSNENVLDPPYFWHHYTWKVHNPYSFTLENVGMVRTFSWVTVLPTPGVPVLSDYVPNPWDDTTKTWYTDHATNPNILDGQSMRTWYYRTRNAPTGGSVVQNDLFSMSRSMTNVPLSYTPTSRTYNVWDSARNEEVPYTVPFQAATLSETDMVPVIWLGDIAPNSDKVFDVYMQEEHDLTNVFAGYSTGFYVSTTAVPEPSSIVALAGGLVPLLGMRRRRS